MEKAREYNIIKIETNNKGANAIIGIDVESSMSRDIVHIMIYGPVIVVEENL